MSIKFALHMYPLKEPRTFNAIVAKQQAQKGKEEKTLVIKKVTYYFLPYMKYTRKIIHSVGSFFYFFISAKLPTLFVQK